MRSCLCAVILCAPVVSFVAMVVMARLTTLSVLLVPEDLRLLFPLITMLFFSVRLSSPPPPADTEKDTVGVLTAEHFALPCLLIIGPLVMYASCAMEGLVAVSIGPDRAMVLCVFLGIWPGAMFLPLRLIWPSVKEEPTEPLAALVAIEARRKGEGTPAVTSRSPAAAPAAIPATTAATAPTLAAAPALAPLATSAPSTVATTAQASAVLEVDPNEECKGLKAWLKRHGLDKYHDKAAQLAAEFEASEISDLAMLEPEEFDVKLMEGMPKIPKTKFEKAMAELRANS